jgi:integrase
MSARRTPPRALTKLDRDRIVAELNRWAAGGSFLALRTRAFVFLAMSSALRTKELLALDVQQVLEDPKHRRTWRVRGDAYLRAAQSKGRRVGTRTWASAGQFVITKRARAALRAYIADCVARGWMTLPPAPGAPLFIAHSSTTGKGHPRIMRGTAQHAWHEAQQRAGLQRDVQYGVHCLRHDALTRMADRTRDPFKVSKYGRVSIETAQRYVHTSPAAIAELAELAS